MNDVATASDLLKPFDARLMVALLSCEQSR